MIGHISNAVANFMVAKYNQSTVKSFIAFKLKSAREFEARACMLPSCGTVLRVAKLRYCTSLTFYCRVVYRGK